MASPVEGNALATKTDHQLLVAIAVELRLQSLLFAKAINETDDLQELRQQIAGEADYGDTTI